ncbi:MAG: hypothetical protein Tsb0020_40950 [Haliangiales bacterium]
MFEPASDSFFSYAFTLTFRERVAIDPTSLEALMDQYFRGLMAAVAHSRALELDVDAIATTVTRDERGLQAEVALIDAFVTGAPLTLWMRFNDDSGWRDRHPEGRCLRVRASSKPYSDAVWSKLADAAACLPCGL